MATVRDVVTALDEMFPPGLAQDWDAIGLTVGDPAAAVERVVFAVDPTLATAQEALDRGAQLLVTHHPLMLRGVTTVAADTPKGAVIQKLIEGGCALYNAHTNADAAADGVNEALAAAIGLASTSPIVPSSSLPELGLGRVGTLSEPLSLRDFAQRVASVLPRTAHGVRVAGDLDMTIETVAVMSGAGDSEFAAVRATGADAYVTADLRHHPASEAREAAELMDGKPALVDVSHYASEWAWLEAAAARVAESLGVDTHVSTLVTDPWTARFGAEPAL